MKSKKNILVITYWSFRDALIQTYTLPYVRLISNSLSPDSKIYLVTLEQKNHQMTRDEQANAKRNLSRHGIHLIFLKYRKPGLLGTIGMIGNGCYMFFLILFSGISYIHGWCSTAGAIAYILSRMTGRPFVVDSYEPHAEVMVETGTWRKTSIKYKLLFHLEKLQCKYAKALITCTSDMKDYCKDKFGIVLKNQWVKPACVNTSKFSLSDRKVPELLSSLGLEGKIVGVYAGKFGGLYLTVEVFDFIKVCHNFWKGKFKMLLLTNESDEVINELKNRAGIPEGVVLKRFVSHEEVSKYIGLGDFGLSPYNPVPSRKFSAPIKNSEYMALGLPIVITKNIADDSLMIEQNNLGAVIKELTEIEYKKCAEKIDLLLSQNSMVELYKKIRPFAERYKNFSIAEKIYSEIYNGN